MLRESAHLRDRVLHLRTLPFMRGLSSSDLAGIASYATEKSFAIGDTLFEAGEEVHHVYLIVHGRIGLYRGDQEQAVLGAPANVGSLAFLAGVPIPYDAVVLEPVLAIAIDADTMLGIIEMNPELNRSTIRFLAEELLELRGDLPFSPSNAPHFPEDEPVPGPQGFVERLLRLRALGPFQSANIDALAELAKAETEERVPAGTMLWNRGDPSTFAFTVVHGWVRCDNGTDSVRVGANFRLGTMDSTAGLPRAYTAVTESDVVGIVSPSNAMFSVIEDQFELTLSLLNGMATAVLAERQKRFEQRADT